MSRPWRAIGVLGACLAAVLAALGWVTLLVLRADRAQRVAQTEAAVEENVRLALWRMEASLAPLLTRESMRPYYVYQSFFRSGALSGSAAESPDWLVPSPLLAAPPAHVRLYFQVAADGTWTSPLVPRDAQRDLALAQGHDAALFDAAAADLQALAEATTWDDLCDVAPGLPAATLDIQPLPTFENPLAQSTSRRGNSEFQARSQQVLANNSLLPPDPTLLAAGLQSVPLQAAWVDGRLLLVRRVVVAQGELLQGCWLNWESLHSELLSLIRDLLPQAELQLVFPGTEPDPLRQLAALPIRLGPGALPDLALPRPTPLEISLWVAWTCVLLAVGAIVLLATGIVTLGERRAAFVSAVTHELRSPLTTLRLYADLLGAPQAGPEQRRAYLQTLQAEADRLAHLVENVLSYARLERGRLGRQRQTLSVEGLVNQMLPRLAARCAQAQAELDCTIPDDLAGTWVQTDPAAVEQILFNLVDNACKYGLPTGDGPRLIELQVQGGAQAELYVRDRGPGVPAAARRRWRQPFGKSAEDAVQTAPGVGLGLALSRRLARALGGELRYAERSGGGAEFKLVLPLASPPPGPVA